MTRYFYHDVQCNFLEFLSAYLAAAAQLGAPENEVLDTTKEMIDEHRQDMAHKYLVKNKVHFHTGGAVRMSEN